ncbi:MAG: hypothetical protein WAO71_11125 [Gallionella sp.]
MSPEIFGSAIVLVGNFNPAIFSPDWLENNGLIGNGDAEEARQSPSFIISRQVSVFETDWFALQVLENQLSLTSKGALSAAFKDLAVGILSLLSHTPIAAIGLNFLAHYRLASEADYHKVGDILAPKAIWSNLYPVENSAAGLVNLSIMIQPCTRTQARTQAPGDVRNISVQPSDKFKYGVFLNYNDHRIINNIERNDQTMAEHAASIIDADWQNAWDDALRVFALIVTRALA